MEIGDTAKGTTVSRNRLRSSSFYISDLLGGTGLRVMNGSCTLSPELEIGNVPTSLALIHVQFEVSS
jgi:hypothetical protein